jgi:hypothetical protein
LGEALRRQERPPAADYSIAAYDAALAIIDAIDPVDDLVHQYHYVGVAP